jgi:hypothetical protein
MRKIAVSFLLACALCLAGCFPIDSLNPLYSDNNVIFDPALLGRWSGSEPNEFLRVERGENGAYLIVYEKKDNDAAGETIFEAHLVSLGGEKYLDLVPTAMKWPSASSVFQMDSAKKGARFAPSLQRVATGLYVEIAGPSPVKGTMQELQLKLRPAHWIMKVEIHEKSVSLIYLDDDWVEKAIKKRLIQASHLKTTNEEGLKNWVLTGSTAELQQLVVRAADDPEAFGAGLAFQKVQ